MNYNYVPLSADRLIPI